MSTGRKTLDDLLAPISQRLGRGAAPQNVSVPAWQHQPARYTDGLSAEQLVDLFAAEAEKVRVGVHRCAPGELAACIAGIVGNAQAQDGSAGLAPGAGGDARGVVYADDERFEAAGLGDALRALPDAGPVRVWDAAQPEASIEAAASARFGITYALAGVAETATVAQPASSTCGRSVSLLPLEHIAVLDADSIVATLGQVLARCEGAVAGAAQAATPGAAQAATPGAAQAATPDASASGEPLPSQLCFISGPSATADIELVRVEGVHGPMFVHYVIVG